MPTFKELAKQDPMLRNVVIIGSLFVILPPILSYFDDPYGWKPDLWKMMARAALARTGASASASG